MTKAGIHRDDVSKFLNHVDRGARATKVYDRYEYAADKRAALDAWMRRLDVILNAPSNVVPFNARYERPPITASANPDPSAVREF
jgi:hypothetical protein